jgi:hypothetical protein
MSRKPLVLPALAVLLGGALALAYAASGSDVAGHTVSPPEPHLARAYPRAAAAAYGRRVLVLRARPLDSVAGEILESARVGGGWELHPVAPAGADAFATALAELALDAAQDWDDDALLGASTVDALGRAGVAVVVVENGREVLTPERAADVNGLSPEPSVPGLRVRAAEPVLRVVGEETVAGAPRARLAPARVRDFRDGLWGGSVIVEAEEAGTFVLSWPREGALLKVGGRGGTLREPVTAVPLVTIDLPAGETEIEVTYAAAAGRSTWAIGGALAVVLSIVVILLATRPHPERAVDPDDEEVAS